MADSYSEPVVFEGTDPKECEAFVAAVRRRALEQDKHRDNEWMAVFASTYLGGDALYWYEDLDEGVQNDWSRLRPALLGQFGRRKTPAATSGSPTTSPSTSSTTIPTAAAAPPRPAATSSPLVRKGRLQVLNTGGVLLGYIQKKKSREGIHLSRPGALSDALLVSFPASADEPFEIRIVDTPERLQGVDALAIGWPGLPNDHVVDFLLCTAACCSISTLQRPQMAAQQKVWTISHGGELIAKYRRPDDGVEGLQSYEDQPGGSVCWMTERALKNRSNTRKVKIVFEDAV